LKQAVDADPSRYLNREAIMASSGKRKKKKNKPKGK